MEVEVFGITRSGTTLIYNISKELFGKNNVNVTHTYTIPSKITIICLRDFRDCMVSNLKVLNNNFSLFKLIKIIYYHKKSLIQLRKYEKSNKKIIWLRYDRFVNDFNYIFDKFELELNQSFDLKLRDEIKNKYNIDEMKKISDKLKTFDNVDDKTKIHGNHIVDSRIGYWEEYIPKKYHILIYFIMRRELIDYMFSRYNKLSSQDKGVMEVQDE